MEPVKRWIVEISHKRYALIDDPEELDGWDDKILEIKLPASAAEMLDATMRAYYNVQTYLDAQWEIAEKRAGTREAIKQKKQINIDFKKILIENQMLPDLEDPENPENTPPNVDI